MAKILADYMTPKECAAELKINNRTLDRWRRLKEAPPWTKIGKKVWYRRQAVSEWLRSREREIEAA